MAWLTDDVEFQEFLKLNGEKNCLKPGRNIKPEQLAAYYGLEDTAASISVNSNTTVNFPAGKSPMTPHRKRFKMVAQSPLSAKNPVQSSKSFNLGANSTLAAFDQTVPSTFTQGSQNGASQAKSFNLGANNTLAAFDETNASTITQVSAVDVSKSHNRVVSQAKSFNLGANNTLAAFDQTIPAPFSQVSNVDLSKSRNVVSQAKSFNLGANNTLAAFDETNAQGLSKSFGSASISSYPSETPKSRRSHGKSFNLRNNSTLMAFDETNASKPVVDVSGRNVSTKSSNLSGSLVSYTPSPVVSKKGRFDDKASQSVAGAAKSFVLGANNSLAAFDETAPSVSSKLSIGGASNTSKLQSNCALPMSPAKSFNLGINSTMFAFEASDLPDDDETVVQEVDGSVKEASKTSASVSDVLMVTVTPNPIAPKRSAFFRPVEQSAMRVDVPDVSMHEISTKLSNVYVSPAPDFENLKSKRKSRLAMFMERPGFMQPTHSSSMKSKSPLPDCVKSPLSTSTKSANTSTKSANTSSPLLPRRGIAQVRVVTIEDDVNGHEKRLNFRSPRFAALHKPNERLRSLAQYGTPNPHRVDFRNDSTAESSTILRAKKTPEMSILTQVNKTAHETRTGDVSKQSRMLETHAFVPPDLEESEVHNRFGSMLNESDMSLNPVTPQRTPCLTFSRRIRVGSDSDDEANVIEVEKENLFDLTDSVAVLNKTNVFDPLNESSLAMDPLVLKKKPEFYLCKRELIAPKERECCDKGIRRSSRTKIPTCRKWMNEFPIYEYSPGGTQTVVGITDVMVTDKTAQKYLTTSPTVQNEKRAEEKRRRKKQKQMRQEVQQQNREKFNATTNSML